MKLFLTGTNCNCRAKQINSSIHYTRICDCELIIYCTPETVCLYRLSLSTNPALSKGVGLRSLSSIAMRPVGPKGKVY